MEKPTPEMFEGLWAPEYCPRQRTDCKSLAQIIAGGHASFICCGENDGSSRELKQDEFRVCFKNAEIDQMTDYDKRDIIQTAAVLMNAAAVIEEQDCMGYHEPPKAQPTESGDG